MKIRNVSYSLDENHRVVIQRDGSRWQLKRRSQKKGERRKWQTIGSGHVTDTDAELMVLIQSTQRGTDITALKVSIGMQRAAYLREEGPSTTRAKNGAEA